MFNRHSHAAIYTLTHDNIGCVVCYRAAGSAGQAGQEGQEGRLGRARTTGKMRLYLVFTNLLLNGNVLTAANHSRDAAHSPGPMARIPGDRALLLVLIDLCEFSLAK